MNPSKQELMSDLTTKQQSDISDGKSQSESLNPCAMKLELDTDLLLRTKEMLEVEEINLSNINRRVADMENKYLVEILKGTSNIDLLDYGLELATLKFYRSVLEDVQKLERGEG